MSHGRTVALLSMALLAAALAGCGGGDGDAELDVPFSRLGEEAPVNDAIEGRPLVVFFDPRVASALDDETIASGRQVGSAAVFERSLGAGS